jgi:hypothetical protein
MIRPNADQSQAARRGRAEDARRRTGRRTRHNAKGVRLFKD